jgi:hypothetical protein
VVFGESAESVIYDSDDIWEGKEDFDNVPPLFPVEVQAQHHFANGDGAGPALESTENNAVFPQLGSEKK